MIYFQIVKLFKKEYQIRKKVQKIKILLTI